MKTYHNGTLSHGLGVHGNDFTAAAMLGSSVDSMQKPKTKEQIKCLIGALEH